VQRQENLAMITTELRLPEIGLLAGTRGLLGAGIALLIANRLSEAQRKDIGWTLVAIGVVTTLPLALMVFDRQRMRRS
jgi:EamA domain-containing membrane protein RarD